MLLLDAGRRIVDLNPAARRLLDLPEGDLIGVRADQALHAHPEISRLLYQEAAVTTELALTTIDANGARPQGERRYLRVQITPLLGARKRVAGLVAICHDITQRKSFEQSLKAQIRQIEALQKDLRDQATRDALTGLFNRRYIQETLPRELARAGRERSPVSLVMLDLDHFKRLNDAYGHPAGDLLLQRLSQILTENTRRGDIVARYGGEEFLVALMDSTPDAARKRAEQGRTEFAACAVPYEGHLLQTTVSAGLASFPGDGASLDELVRKADAALYQAKAAGRNRVVVFEGGL
jgi:diguanylate cyclase (GGDEF)-like protein/PAS domain S-box-containing protein